MANSSIIPNAKRKIISEFINNEDFVKALNIQDSKITDETDLINQYIFDYNQNPFTIQNDITFVTVQVHIPAERFYGDTHSFVHPEVEIWIYSHYKNMKVDNIPKVNMNRNDYLSVLVDNMLNGRSDFGIGNLELLSNVEGTLQADYLFRALRFRGTDLNKSLCNED